MTTALAAAQAAAATLTDLGGTLPTAVTDQLDAYAAAAEAAAALATPADDLGEAAATAIIAGLDPAADTATQAAAHGAVLASHVDDVRGAVDAQVATWVDATFRPAVQTVAVARYTALVATPVGDALAVLGAGPLTRYAGATGAAAAAVADVQAAEVAAAQLASCWAVGRDDAAEHDALLFATPATAEAYQAKDADLFGLAGAGWDLALPADDQALAARHVAAQAL